MPDYSKTIIYKIQHQDKPELIYIGHTTNFNKRKYEHKRVSNNLKTDRDHYKLYQTIRENGGWIEFKMIQVKEFPCQNKREACLEEDRVMLELKANLNKYRAKDFNRDEWYENNKEKLTEHKHNYYKENKEYLQEKQKEWREKNKEKINEKCVCELCGLILSKKSLTRHNKRKH